MTKRAILILAAGPLQLPAIRVAKAMNLRVVALDHDPNAPGLALADTAHVVDITDPDACLKIARQEQIDGVLHICSEVAMPALGLINESLMLHGPDQAAVQRATNKASMRKAFEIYGAPSPVAFNVSNVSDAFAAMKKLKGTVIVKPARNSGSRGITHLPPDASEACMHEAFRKAMHQSRDPTVLVEEFIDGPEFSIEMLIYPDHDKILVITDKNTTGKPHYVELGHTQPTSLDQSDIQLLTAAASDGVRALNLEWCAAHVEIKLGTKGPYLIEIGARLGGDFITTELVPRSTGVDMVAAAIQLVLGEEPVLTSQYSRRGAAIRYLAPPPGVVQCIEGSERARAMPGVEIVEVYVKPGDRIGALDSSLARAGHVIAEGVDAEEAARRAEEARDVLTIAVSSRQTAG